MANVVQDELTINIKSRADDASQSVKKLKNDLQGLSTILKGFGVGAMFKGLKNIGSSMFGFLQKTSDYIQTMNQFKMVMGESADRAQEFVDKAERIFGLDPSKMQTALATFKSLGESFGIASDDAYKMSVNLTQLAADMSSMKNISFEQSLQKIKSGFVGEIEPMRAVGVALDKATLQQTAYTLGIEQRIDTMTRAQKTELLYYQMMTATEQMQGNMAKQLITPAAAMRQIQAEMAQLGRAVGSILIPAFMAIAPVIRAITELATEAAQALAAMFGFELGDFAVSAGDVSSSLSDIGGGLGDIGTGARKATKELNKMLMPFDELNNINLENKSGSAGGAGGVGGIGGSLGIPLKEYDMFANASDEMRQKIDSIKQAIKDFLPVIKVVGAALATLWVVDKVVKFIDWVVHVKETFGKLLTWLKGTKLGSLITSLGSKLKDLFWNSNLGQSIKKFTTSGEGLGKMLLNIAAAVGGVILSIKGFADMNDVMAESWKTGSVDGGKYALALGEIAGGFALVGASIAGLPGAIIGGFVGLVVGFVESLMVVPEKANELKQSAEALNKVVQEQKEVVDKDVESWNNLAQSTKEAVEKQVAQSDYIADLVDELDNLADSEGKVQEGDKARVDFILNEVNKAYNTEYKLVGNQITQNGKEVKSLKELKDAIQDVIIKKKAEAVIDATADKYAKALQEKSTYYHEYQTALKNQQEAAEKIKKIYEKYGITLDEINRKTLSALGGTAILEETKNGLSDLVEAYEASTDSVEKSGKAWEESVNTIREVEALRTAELTGEVSEIEKAMNNITEVVEVNGKKQAITTAESLKEQLDAYKLNYDKMEESQKKSFDTRLAKLSEELVKETNEIKTYSPETIEAWKKMAETSQEVYNENISKVSEGTRLAIETSIGTVDANSPDTINRWKKLAQDSEEEYNRALGLLPEDTKNAIDSAVGTFYKDGQKLKDAGSYGGNQAAAGTNEGYKNNLNLKISGKDIEVNPKGFDNLGSAISSLIQNNLSSFTMSFALGSSKIPNFATGGFPETGQLFVANEAGPELVGNIGRKTAVANQGQITEGIADATYSAISRALAENKSNGGSTPYITVNVGNERLYSGYGKYQNEQSNMYGVTV